MLSTAKILAGLGLLYALCLSASAATTTDKSCSQSMCVSLAVDDSNTTFTYELEALREVGWMAIGFGPSMFWTPLVITWPNNNGNVTLTQRKTDNFVMPTPVPNPPRIATLTPDFPSFNQETHPKISLQVPTTNQTDQVVAWAFSDDRPPSSDPNTDILKHSDAGLFRLNVSSAFGGSYQSGLTEGHSLNKILVAHAAFASFGFLVVLPLGVLVARLGRTFTPSWFRYHQMANMFLSLPFIVLGFVLAVVVVARNGQTHFFGPHPIGGLILVVLYILQIFLGRFIHSNRVLDGVKFHPARNIAHAALGTLIIALAFCQVRTGFDLWQAVTSQKVPAWAQHLWLGWLVTIAVVYLGGLALLPLQFSQEKMGIVNITKRSNGRKDEEDGGEAHSSLYSLMKSGESESQEALLSPPLRHSDNPRDSSKGQ